MSMPYLLPPNDPSGSFPDPAEAMRDPDGLLAVGGDLSSGRLINAYREGIFPWYNEGDPILWWSPDPRTVLRPRQLHCSRSLRKLLRQRAFAVTMDRDFPAVIRACAEPRAEQQGTWLLPEMIQAYCALHLRGIAHSIEVWQGGQLVGGLYGVVIGGAFFGESMFSRVANASKVALVQLCEHLLERGVELIDCQVLTGHLRRMGAELIPRAQFLTQLRALRDAPLTMGSWDDGRWHHPSCPQADVEPSGGELAPDQPLSAG
jgi:leucyl/phenylalanyl-tRNA--protein transferase